MNNVDILVRAYNAPVGNVLSSLLFLKALSGGEEHCGEPPLCTVMHTMSGMCLGVYEWLRVCVQPTRP